MITADYEDRRPADAAYDCAVAFPLDRSGSALPEGRLDSRRAHLSFRSLAGRKREGVRLRSSAHPLARRSGRVAQLRAARPRRAAWPCRARELLDADVHQLAAPGAVRPCLVACLPGRRAGRDRSPHAGVHVRARDRPRPASDEGARDRLPGRGRQRLRDLERLRQPLLAGALLRRRRRHHPRPPLRRGPLRAIGARHPAAARRRARARLRRRARRRGGSRLGPPAHARDLSRLRAQRALRLTRRRRGRPTPRLRAPRASSPQPLGPRRRVDDRA